MWALYASTLSRRSDRTVIARPAKPAEGQDKAFLIGAMTGAGKTENPCFGLASPMHVF